MTRKLNDSNVGEKLLTYILSQLIFDVDMMTL
jgi:hypothetical protein